MIRNVITRPVRTVSGFAGGFRYPLIAAFFIIRHASLWPWCIIPVLINIVVLYFFWGWTGSFSNQLLQTYITDDPGWWWEILRKGAWALAFFLRLIVTVLAFVIVGSLIAVPFNDLLSEQTDKLASGWKDPRPFSAARTARELTITGFQEIKRMALFLAIIIPLFALEFIPLLAPFALAIKLTVTALFFTSDYISYPMERRGALLFRHKFMIARRYLFPSLGFGLAVTCIAFIPIVNFLFFPLAVVGGTLLFGDLLRQHGSHFSDGLPIYFNPDGPPGTPKTIIKPTPSAPRPDPKPAPAPPPPPPPPPADDPAP